MSHNGSKQVTPYWSLFVGRSVLAAAAAAIVTFSPNHTPGFGLVVSGALALATGVLGLALSRNFSSAPQVARILRLSEAASVVIGVAAVVVAVFGGGLIALVAVIAAFGAVSLVAQLTMARVRADGGPSVGDHRVLAAVSALLVGGVVVANDNSVVVVGILGAWAAVTAVYSLITAFTLKWENDRGTDQVVNL